MNIEDCVQHLLSLKKLSEECLPAKAEPNSLILIMLNAETRELPSNLPSKLQERLLEL
jgi:hypothetical protein